MLSTAIKFIIKLGDNEVGQDLIEYVSMASLIALAAIVWMWHLDYTVGKTFAILGHILTSAL